MSSIESIYAAVRFIETHLKAPVSVEEIADAAGFSLCHFSRTFNGLVGHSPFDYLIRRRLSASTSELLTGKDSILNIALAYQFNHAETYTRAFRRMFGVPPSRFKGNRYFTRMAFPPTTPPAYLKKIRALAARQPDLVTLEPFYLVGLAVWERDAPTWSAPLWNRLLPEIQGLAGRLHPDRRYGVTFYSPEWEEAGCFYMAGVVLAQLARIPPTLIAKQIPGGRYARFLYQGERSELNLLFDFVYQTWLPRAGTTLAAPMEIEIQRAGPGEPEAACTEIEILIPIE